MSRLFYVSGDSNLAIRTIRLYVQVVGKAWETANAEAPQKQEDTSTSSVESVHRTDTDRNWVQALVQGARMLCRVACSKSGTVLGTTGNGLDEAKEAGVLIEKAKIGSLLATLQLLCRQRCKVLQQLLAVAM